MCLQFRVIVYMYLLTPPYDHLQDFHHVMGFGMKTINDAENIFEGGESHGQTHAARRSEDDR
jgi:hypothetical protein